MALSDYEKHVLEQMEEEFRRADPAFASEMEKPIEEPPSGPLSPRRIALGAVLALSGLGVLVGAVSLGYSIWSILLGVLGFVFMVAGVWYAISSPKGGRGRASRSSRPEAGGRLGGLHPRSGAPLGGAPPGRLSPSSDRTSPRPRGSPRGRGRVRGGAPGLHFAPRSAPGDPHLPPRRGRASLRVPESSWALRLRRFCDAPEVKVSPLFTTTSFPHNHAEMVSGLVQISLSCAYFLNMCGVKWGKVFRGGRR